MATTGQGRNVDRGQAGRDQIVRDNSGKTPVGSDFIEKVMEDSGGSSILQAGRQAGQVGQQILQAGQQAGGAPVEQQNAGSAQQGATRPAQQQQQQQQQQRVAETSFPTKNLVDSYNSQARAVSRMAAGLPLVESPRVDLHPGTGRGMAAPGTVQAQPGSGYSDAADAAQPTSANQLAPQQRQHGQQGQPALVDSRDRQDAGTSEDIEEQHRRDVDISRRQRYEYDNARGRGEIFEHGAIRGATPMSRPYKNNSKSNRRFAKSFARFRKSIANRISAKTYRGDSFYDKIHTSGTLLPNEVALGTENIREALREPNSPFLDIVNQKLIETYGEDAPQIDREIALRDISIIANLLNGVPSSDGSGQWIIPPLDIEVVFDKSPVNWGPSIQVRTLRVRSGNGIFLHPTQCKGFNADFDGDPGSLNIDQSLVGRYDRAMSYLVDTEGNPMIDMKFFPLDEAPTSSLEIEHMAACMLEGPFSWLSEYDIGPGRMATIAKVYSDVCNNPSDENWKNLLEELDKLAESIDTKKAIGQITVSAIIGSKSGSYDADENDRVRRIRSFDTDISDRARKMHSESVSRLFYSIYEFGVIRRRLSLSTQYPQVFVDSEDDARLSRDSNDPVIWHLVMYHDDVAEGRAAPNFQSFAKSFRKVYGDVDNANVPFRLVADFAKAINRTDAIRIGSDIYDIYQIVDEDGNVKDSVTLEDLWRFTCSCAVTTAISGELRYGSRDGAIATVVKTMVVREMGPLPDWSDPVSQGFENADEMFASWTNRFVDCYNKHMRLIGVSQVSWRHGGLPSRDGATRFDGVPDRGNREYGDKLADALVRVYGDVTVGTLFPVPFYDGKREMNTSMGSIHRKYENMGLEEFVYKNRLPWISDNEGVGKMEGMGKRLSTGRQTISDVIWLVADRRTKQTGEYMESWLKATQDHFDRIDIYRIRKKARAGKIDEVMSDIMECIHMMSPDMFDFFEMSSPESFLNSVYGRRFFESKDVSEFRSNLLSMLVEYRLSRSAEVLNDIYYEQENADPAYPTRSQARLDELEAVFEYELDSLGSSSYAWDTICMEMTGMNRRTRYSGRDAVGEDESIFEHLVSLEDRSPNKGWKMYAADVWQTLGAEGSPTSIVEFLKSDASFDDKINVLTDVVRVAQDYSSLTPNEMLGQLAHHPDRLHAGNRFDMDKGLRNEIDSVKESSERITSFSKSRKNVKRESRRILRDASKNPEAFDVHLRRLASDPGYHVHIDPILAADAVASVFDPTYSDSEKIRQQAAVNGYFECISYQRSGGFFTHLNQTDNAVINMVGANQISEFDIIRVLGDPSISLTVYDEFGCPTTISRRSLCGDDSIYSVIEFLKQHPKLALATRRLTCGIRSTGKNKFDGQATLNAISEDLDSDMVFGDSTEQRIFNLLCDRPRFLSLAALISPANENVGRNLSERVYENIMDLCLVIGNVASESALSRDLIRSSLGDLGITEDTLGAIRTSDFDGYLEESGIETEEDVDDFVTNLIEEVVTEVLECAQIVSKSPDIKIVAQVVRPHSIDESSIRAYYAAKQQLGGARTQKMISVEGAETKRNLVLKEFLRNEQPLWRMTEDGPVRIDQQSQQMSMFGEDADMPNPSFSMFQDSTFERDPMKQVHPIAKWLEIKREKGAEDYNAKTKKFGDDGTNSIIKFTRMATRRVFSRYGMEGRSTSEKNGIWTVEDGSDLIASVAAIGNVGENATDDEMRAAKDRAVGVLAQALIDADARLGYVDFDDSGEIDDNSFNRADYYERAEMMIAYNSDGTIVIRSLEQIALACEMRLSDIAIESQDADTIRAEIAEIIAVLGTDMDPMLHDRTEHGIALDCMLGARTRNGIGTRFRASRALSRRMSSVDRAYEHMLHYRSRYEQMYEREWLKAFEKAEASGDSAAIDNLNAKRLAPPPKSRKQLDMMAEDAMSRIARRYPVKRSKRNSALVNEIEDLSAQSGAGSDYAFNLIGFARSMTKYNSIEPGPLSLVFFDSGWDKDANAVRAIKWCEMFGMTAAFDGLDAVPEEYIQDAIRVSENIWILPFFDMRLNGSMSSPSSLSPGEYICNPSNFVVNGESTMFEIRPGDSTYHMTRELFDRIRIFRHFTETYTSDDLFPNVDAAYPGSVKTLDYCDRAEVEQFLLEGEFNKETCAIDGPMGSVTVDLGIDVKDPGYSREADRFALRFQEYKDNRDNVDDNGIIDGECRYDSVVGFVKILIDGNKVVFAPITAFHLENSGRVPHKFKIDGFELDRDTHRFTLRCHYTGGLKGQIIKFFEGIGASTKMTASDELIESRELENGLSIDGMYATGTVSSRLFSSNKRAHTMISLMYITRMDPKYAYNFAEDKDAFPGDPTVMIDDEEVLVRDALLDCRLDREHWRIATGWTPESGCPVRFFHNDPEIDAFVRYWVDLCFEYGTVNPTTLLATKSRQGMLVPRVTEFEAFMDTSINFQNAFMKFFYAMTVGPDGNGAICPPSIEDPENISARTLFKPVNEKAFAIDSQRKVYPRYKQQDYGVLQMLVPYRDEDTGEWFKVPENVYISMGFFGDEFTGFTKKNFNTYRQSIDTMNVVPGNIDGFDLSQMMAFARAGMAHREHMGSMTALPDMSKDGYGNWNSENYHEDDRVLDPEEWGRILAVTGHRPQHMPDDWDDKNDWDPNSMMWVAAGQRLVEYCHANGIDTVITGMAQGLDMAAASAVIQDPKLKLIAAIPFPESDSAFTDRGKEWYDRIIKAADKVVYVSDEPINGKDRDSHHKESTRKLMERNEWMIDNADEVFALYMEDKKSGGTYNAVEYARDSGKYVEILDPNDMLKE